jgi:hypothetical protein
VGVEDPWQTTAHMLDEMNGVSNTRLGTSILSLRCYTKGQVRVLYACAYMNATPNISCHTSRLLMLKMQYASMPLPFIHVDVSQDVKHIIHGLVLLNFKQNKEYCLGKDTSQYLSRMHPICDIHVSSNVQGRKVA